MSQEKIWDFFQSDGREAFAGSVPRLRFLFERARQRVGRRHAIRALNIGIGSGWLERRCQEVGWSACALDPSQKAVQELRASGIDARAGYLGSMPFADAGLDVIFCSEVLEHLRPDRAREGIREIVRCLAVNGLLVGSVPYREVLAEGTTVCPECGHVFHRWGHQQSFDQKTLTALLEAEGLTVRELGVRAFVDFSGPRLPSRLALTLHWFLGRLGLAIASPTLFFVAVK